MRSCSPAVRIRAPCRRRRCSRSPASSAVRPSEVVRDPRAALARARELAGAGGVVLATGSIYLVADLLRLAAGDRAGRASVL